MFNNSTLESIKKQSKNNIVSKIGFRDYLELNFTTDTKLLKGKLDSLQSNNSYPGMNIDIADLIQLCSIFHKSTGKILIPEFTALLKTSIPKDQFIKYSDFEEESSLLNYAEDQLAVMFIDHAMQTHRIPIF